jgi:hypothetical protein
MEEWISLEQLMHEHGLDFISGDAGDNWYAACYQSMDVLDRLITIVKGAPEPMPIRWLRWQRDTVKSLENFLAMLDMALPDHLRP